jgi:hypothetical protein
LFDVCSGLSRSLQLYRALRGTTDGTSRAQAAAVSQTSGDAPQAPPPAAPGTPVEAFAKAVLLDVKKRACGWILLRCDGNRYRR